MACSYIIHFSHLTGYSGDIRYEVERYNRYKHARTDEGKVFRDAHKNKYMELVKISRGLKILGRFMCSDGKVVFYGCNLQGTSADDVDGKEEAKKLMTALLLQIGNVVELVGEGEISPRPWGYGPPSVLGGR